MSPEHVDRFFTLAFAGSGMLLIGFVNLLVATPRAWVRAAITLPLFMLTVGAIASWTEDWTASGSVAGLLGLTLLPSVLAGPGLREFCQSLGIACGRPAVRWGGLTACGIVLVAGSAGLFEHEDDKWVRKETQDALAASAITVHEAVPGILATTDRGTEVRVTSCLEPRESTVVEGLARQTLTNSGHLERIIHRSPASEMCNCHGWVFAGGQFAVGGDMVDMILQENGYEQVTTPRPGDLAIYRHDDGKPSHTAVVRYVTDGLPVLVEGKWGWMGVYIHEVDKSIYGTNYAYYRSPRSGHLLRLSNTSSPATATASVRR